VPCLPLLDELLTPLQRERRDLKIVDDQDARDLLANAASAHKEAATAAQSPDRHQAVIEIIERILAGKNGMRH
jgi:hypothetical protein